MMMTIRLSFALFVAILSSAATVVGAFSPPVGIGSSGSSLALSIDHTYARAPTPVHFLANRKTRRTTTDITRSRRSSRILVKLLLNIDEDEQVSRRSVTYLPAWLARNRKNLAISTAIVSAAAFAGPVVSHATPLLADLSSVAGGSMDTASTFFEQLSETGFYQAFSLVFLSEIGDKTFFVAGLLAAKLSKFVSFIGSLGALAVMTVLAVLIGQIFHAVPAGLTQGIPIDDICAVAAFTYFGIKILAEALSMDSEGSSFMDEELAEAEETVDESDTITKNTAWAQIASTFTLVFAAEFGDRSFLSTIALSAAQNPVAVGAGSIAAHGIATGIAVVGGAYISRYISEKAIGIIGGSLFLVFAVTTALGIF